MLSKQKLPRTLAEIKTVVTYLNEILLLFVLGGILLIALTGGFVLSFAGISMSAYHYRKPVMLLSILVLLRKLLRGEFFVGFLFPPVVQQVLFRLRAFFQQLVRRITTDSRFRKCIVFGGSLLIGLLLLASLNNYLQQGLTGRYYKYSTEWDGTPYLTVHDRKFDLRRPSYDFWGEGVETQYSIEWSGVIYLAVSGTYEFMTTSDDGSEIWVDNQLVVDNGGFHGVEKQVSREELERGFHPIRIRYMQGEGGAHFEAKWKAPKQKSALFSTAIVFPQQPGNVALAVFWIGRILLVGFKLIVLMSAVIFGLLLGCHHLLDMLHTRVREHHLYVLLSGMLTVVYGIGHALEWRIEDKFGFGALPLSALLIGVFFLLSAILLYRKNQVSVRAALQTVSDTLYSHKLLQILLVIACVGLFFSLRNEFMNTDGIMYKWVIPNNFQEHGTPHIRFDEMWEFYFHSQFWRVMNSYFQWWSVRLSYQILSALAGGGFIVVLLMYSRRLFPDFPLPFFLLMLASGYMQLFFGDVENYTLTGVMVLAYLWSSLLYLQGKQSLILPSAVLALAMTFHMLAGFMGLSLAYLYLLELREKRYRQIGLSLLVFVAIFGFTLAFHDMLSLDKTYRASWGGVAISQTGMWAVFAFDQYHWQQYNLLALMFPAHLLLLPLLVFKRIKLDRVNIHLLLAVVGMMLFHFNYKGLLGAYLDWNLYANAAIPLAALVWRNVLAVPNLKYKWEILFGVGGLSALHSLAWIIANHKISVIVPFIGG